MTARIYVEGGGDQERTLDACRRGFAQFFAKVAPAGARPRVIPAGSRKAAYDDFCHALDTHPEEFVVLLVDSEDPVQAGTTAWAHLRARSEDRWSRPTVAGVDQAHLMVQCMEAWLLADRETLASFYGQEFLAHSLPGQPNVELIAKRDVVEALERASTPTQKGQYHKTKHGFVLLERTDPMKVRNASAHADALFRIVAGQ